MTVTKIAQHTHPNAVCAIHRLRGSVVSATAEVTRPNIRYFVCDFHAGRARSSEFFDMWHKLGRIPTREEADSVLGQET